MNTATKIKDLSGFTGHAALYRLSEPVKSGYDEEGPETEYVVVSATSVMFSGPETYIFPADENGNVIDWGELPGSMKGTLDHENAIIGAGWKLPD